MKVAPEVPAKNPKDYKIVGKNRFHVLTSRKKFTGEFVYSQDVGVPGMLHGRVGPSRRLHFPRQRALMKARSRIFRA